MDADDKDLPAAYLYFAVLAMVAIAVAAGGAFVILIRN
jgi:hypothetical protein